MPNKKQAILFVLTITSIISISSQLRAEESQQKTVHKASPILVIAHRGASGYRPEHTLAAYELAIEMGADYVEPDLVPTKDNVLVARHENEISGTTDVAEHPEFQNRKTKKIIDGKPAEGWFTEDFTLAELKTLRAKERMPNVRQHNTIYNSRYAIPTFQEIIDLVKRKELELHRTIGIYPEAKHPTYFASIGLSNVMPLLAVLQRNGYDRASAPIFIQCFEVSALKELRKKTKLNLVQLIADDELPYDLHLNSSYKTPADFITKTALAEIATYANGIGPNKNLIVPRDSAGNLQQPTSLVQNAHAAGLVVHPWTFRNENEFLPADLRRPQQQKDSTCQRGDYGDAIAEYKIFAKAGVDGFFTENPDTARASISDK